MRPEPRTRPGGSHEGIFVCSMRPLRSCAPRRTRALWATPWPSACGSKPSSARRATERRPRHDLAFAGV
jgi:hypothetical protein